MKRLTATTVIVILLFSLVSCSKVGECGIKSITLTSEEKQIKLTEGETSDNLSFVAETDDLDTDDIEFVTNDPSVAYATYVKVHGENEVIFRINAVEKGMTSVYFRTRDRTVVSDKITVYVSESSVAQTEEAVEPRAMPSDGDTAQSETDNEQIAEDNEPAPANPNGDIAYVTPTGKRYHLRKTCAGKNAKEITLDEAKKTYTPCKKCAQ